jgi:hypothetical protein
VAARRPRARTKLAGQARRFGAELRRGRRFKKLASVSYANTVASDFLGLQVSSIR